MERTFYRTFQKAKPSWIPTPTEAMICAKIHQFDIHALLDLLNHLGYRREEIFFKSNWSSVSPPNLLSKIEFRSTPIRQVIITVNIGLLSVLSPLPSYFMKTLDTQHLDEKAVTDFLGFFDHILLQSYFYSIYPESDTSIYSNWDNTKLGYIRLLGINSVSFLHHIFQQIFPELGVWVEKNRHKCMLSAGAFRLGESKLGSSHVLGSQTAVPVPGFDVTLYSDEEHTDQRTPWAERIAERLHTIVFPILREARTFLKVTLVIRSQKGWVQLKKGSYLGIDRIRGGKEKNRVVIVFRGQVPYSTELKN